MPTLRQNQAELSDVPRRHGQGVGQLSLIASELIPAYVAVAALVSTRAQLPTTSVAIGIGLNRCQAGDRVRVAVPGELVENTAWNWVNGPVRYATGTGVLSQGGTGAIIGIAIAPTKVLVVNAIYAGLEATFANGSVSAPSIAATADLNTGIYWPAADQLGITIGGVLSGKFTTRTLYVGDGVSNSAIYSDGAAGSVSDFGLLTNGSARWIIRRTQTAESGSNAGSDFQLLARSDAGAIIDAPISIARAAGGSITIARPTGFAANAVTGSAIAFTGGSINNVTVGATTATTGRFTTLQSTGLATLASVDIDGGNIDSTAIGATTPSTIVGTTLKASAAASLTDTPIGKSGDPNTGINFPAADQVSLVAGGVSVLDASATSVSFPLGVDFGSAVAASASDLSRHLALWGTTYGFNVTSNTLNYVAPATSGIHSFNLGGTAKLTIADSEISVASGVSLVADCGNTTIAGAASANAGLAVVQSTGASAAYMTFHRSGVYAVHFGLDTDNQFRYGAWSAGATSYKFWTEQNDGPGSGLNADLVDGYNTSEAATASTIAVRTASNYLYSEFFNSTAAVANPTIGSVIVENSSADGFLRKISLANFLAQARTPYVIASGSISTSGDTTINLPAGAWKKLELVLLNLTAGSDYSPYLRFNSDTTAGNYRWTNLFGNASGTYTGVGGATTATAQNLWSTTSHVESTSNPFSETITILDPVSTTGRKAVSFTAGMCIAGIDGVYYGATGQGAWISTSAITSINILLRGTVGVNPTGSTVNATAGTYVLIGYL